MSRRAKTRSSGANPQVAHDGIGVVRSATDPGQGLTLAAPPREDYSCAEPPGADSPPRSSRRHADWSERRRRQDATPGPTRSAGWACSFRRPRASDYQATVGPPTASTGPGYAVTPSGDGITAVSSTFTVPSAGLAPPGIRRYLDRDRRLQHQRPDPGRCLRALGAEQSAPRRSVLRVVRAAARQRDPDHRLHRRRQLHGDPGRQHHREHQPGVGQHLEHRDDRRRQVELEPGRQLRLVGVLGRVDPRGPDARRPDACWRMSAPSTSVRPRRTPPAASPTRSPTGDPTQIFLSPGVVNEATPSALASDGQSFNDCAYAQSCAAP